MEGASRRDHVTRRQCPDVASAPDRRSALAGRRGPCAGWSGWSLRSTPGRRSQPPPDPAPTRIVFPLSGRMPELDGALHPQKEKKGSRTSGAGCVENGPERPPSRAVARPARALRAASSPAKASCAGARGSGRSTTAPTNATGRLLSQHRFVLRRGFRAVSYTHLTLPTSDLV